MTDFSHLHALEERAVNIQRSMMAAKKDVQWRSLAVQLFQTEQEIADERTFLELEDMSTDDLYAALFEEAESEVVREITKELNAAEQAANIRTAAEALVAALTKEPDDYDGLVYYEYSKELAGLQAALSRGWLARKETDPALSNSQLASTQKALKCLYNAVQKSRSVNDPLGMATAMEEAGKWF